MKKRRKSRKRRRTGYRNPPIVKSLGAGLRLPVLRQAAVVLGGVLGNAFASGAALRFMPDVIKTTPAKYLVGLGTAGAVSAIAAMPRATRKAAPALLVGGVLQQLLQAYEEFAPSGVKAALEGMGDFATSNQVATARSLDSTGGTGMGDFATMTQVAKAPTRSVDNAMLQGMEDYTVGTEFFV